ncbi:MAG: LysR family transcriptional regulator [Sphaerochaeta sp.]
MNLLHMKYAVSVAETQSLNKSALRLNVGQPNLSRSIKELENSLGAELFERSPRGMTLTEDGELFIQYARSILKQVEQVEDVLKNRKSPKKSFSIAVPRAGYMCDAFTKFVSQIPVNEEIDVLYRETNAARAIQNIVRDGYRMCILRYAKNYEQYYNALIEEKNLVFEVIAEFRYVLMMNRDSPLYQQEKITYADLSYFIEVVHADPYVPSLPLAVVRKEELPDNTSQRIFVFERGSQMELLSQNSECFMWVSPNPQYMLDRYGLVQLPCEENRRLYRDVLVYRKDYSLTGYDKMFIESLKKSKSEIIDPFCASK